MKSLANFLYVTVYTAGFLIIIAIIGFLWLMRFTAIGPLAIVLLILDGIGAAIAHNKGKEFLEWFFLGTLFPGITLIAAIAIRRSPIVVYVSKEQ